MRVLVLGGTGMLGHKVHEILSSDHDVVSTTRSPLDARPVNAAEFFARGKVIEGVDAADVRHLEDIIRREKPDALVNCIGIVKQRQSAQDRIQSIAINSLLPHQLAATCETHGVRFVHFSTDCVFSGSKGDYVEDDPSDATDLYGRTKYLGEVSTRNAITIRTSLIGRELAHFASLVEWFLVQRGEVFGYTDAIYTGLTTAQMARIVARILEDPRDIAGVYQVASQKITKFDLLTLIRDAFGLKGVIDVVPDTGHGCDRSLRGDRFTAATGIAVPTWPEMIDELARDASRYRRTRD